MTRRDHQYAFDSNGNWVNANKTEYKKHQVYFCECPERHSMKLVKPSGLPEKRPFCDYFAHVAPNFKRHKSMDETISAVKSSCCSGGESFKHKNAKHILRELVGSYYFTTFRCQCCHAEEIMDSVGGSVSMEIVSVDKRWRYDCLLEKDGKAVVAMEVVHTHLTGSVKIDSVRASGLEIVEFRVDDVMEMSKNSLDGGRTKLDNIKIKSGKCEPCLIKFRLKQEEMQDRLKQKEIQNRLKQEEIKLHLKEETQKQLEREETDHRLKQEEIQNRLKQDEETRTRLKLTSQTCQNNKSGLAKPQPQEVYDPPHFIYRSVYHPPDGTPSWTPYEMIAEQI